MKFIFSILFSVIFFGLTNAQSAGLRLYSGVTSATNRVLAVTPSNTVHSGFHFGVDGRLNGGKMFFVVGLRYSSIDLVPTDESNFFSNETQHTIFSGRVGLGWHLIKFGELGSIRGKVLAQLDSNAKFDIDELTPPYDELVDASAGITVGLGVQLKFLTLDVEYEYGLVNWYSQQKETKADVLSLSLGFFF